MHCIQYMRQEDSRWQFLQCAFCYSPSDSHHAPDFMYSNKLRADLSLPPSTDGGVSSFGRPVCTVSTKALPPMRHTRRVCLVWDLMAMPLMGIGTTMCRQPFTHVHSASHGRHTFLSVGGRPPPPHLPAHRRWAVPSGTAAPTAPSSKNHNH
jgi:hypothetical protein